MCLEERSFGSCSACGNGGQMTLDYGILLICLVMVQNWGKDTH